MNKIFKKWYFWVGAFFLLVIIIGTSNSPKKVQVGSDTQETQQQEVNQNDVSHSEKPLVAGVKNEAAPPATTPATKTTENPVLGYKVVSVVDGDTIKVDISGTIETLRIIGLDTPETVDPRKPVQCFGKEASNKAKEFLLGKTVTLEADTTQGERDKYGRLLRYVFISDGTDYGKYMIMNGYAHEYTYSKPYKYQVAYKTAQKNAEASKAGLWAESICSEPQPTTSNTVTENGKYYTSSSSNASKYYPETCTAWQELSKANLRSFSSLNELLKVYPKRTLADVCK